MAVSLYHHQWHTVSNFLRFNTSSIQYIISIGARPILRHSINLKSLYMQFECQLQAYLQNDTRVSSSRNDSHAITKSANQEDGVDHAALQSGLVFIKRTFQPSLIRRKRKHGFLARKRTKAGRRVLRQRVNKGRTRLCA